MKITFDGAEKLMIVNEGITSLNVLIDLYSSWKDWVLTGYNAKYEMAFSAIGGDPITEEISLGSTFFLENGWRIRPYEGDHTLTIIGNLYTREGDFPVVKTIGNYNVMIEISRSNLIDTVATGGFVDVDNLIEKIVEAAQSKVY